MLALFATALSPAISNAAVADSKDTTATINFKAGELKLLTAPNLDFGTDLAIPDVETTYPLSANGDNPISVSDLRGNNEGWKLKATLGTFKNNTVDTLNGSKIVITGLGVTPVGTNSATAPTPNDPIELASGGAAADVITAAAKTGMAGWESILTPANTKITVLGGTALAGTSTATISWSLEDTP